MSPEADAATGKRRMAWKPRAGWLFVDVPCSKCVGCSMDRRRSWTARIVHEAQMHESNCMLTLTYTPAQRPASLVKEHLQGFMHRLRKRVEYSTGARIRFFAPGEYGERSGHPHFHPVIFGFMPNDLIPLSGEGRQAWRSPLIEDVWGMGRCQVDALTPGSAAYAAGYVSKKYLGDVDDVPQVLVDHESGEVQFRPAEFVLMSRRPGIGAAWLDRYWSDVYPSDFVVLDGAIAGKPPRYYDERVKARCPEVIEAAKQRRLELAQEPRRQADSTGRRLRDREHVAKARLRLRARAGV